jgi:hypothetical protein
MCPGFGLQEAARQVVGWVWNDTEQFFRFDFELLVGYPDQWS